LLSHALLETWRRREGNQLTFSGYNQSGGVQGAIAKTAESVFQEQLTSAQQTIARTIFLRLTELGEGTQDTRRRAAISELLPDRDTAEETQTVLNLLSAARLITTDEESAEVAHEALIREWPTLRLWLQDNREGLRLHRHLTESAQAWREMEDDPGELYRGARLEQAEEWADQHGAELNDLEQEFLWASQAARQQEIDAIQAQQRRELEQAQRLADEQSQRAVAEAQAGRRARYFNVALVIILILVTVAALVVLNAQRVQRSADEVAANATLAAVAARETAVSANESALTLAGESTAAAQAAATLNAQAIQEIALNQTRQAESAATATASVLAQDVDADGLSLAEELSYDSDPDSADTDADGLLDGVEIVLGTDLLAFDTDEDGRFDGNDNEPLRPFISAQHPITGEPTQPQIELIISLQDIFVTDENRLPFYSLSMSEDNKRIAAGSYANDDAGQSTTLYVWGIDGSMLTPFDTQIEEEVWASGFAADRLYAVVGTRFYSFNFSGEETEWQTLSGGNVGSTVCSAAIHPDGTTVLMGGRAVWQLSQIGADGLQQIERQSQNEDTNACNTDSIFSYDGTYFGRIEDFGEDESVLVGELLNRSFGRPFNKSVSGALNMALSPDNAILALGFENGRVELYDYAATNNSPPLIYGLDAHPVGFADMLFSPDGTILATRSSLEGVVKLWRAQDGEHLLSLTDPAEATSITSMAFSADGHYLLVGTMEGQIHVYGLPKIRP
jgi:WD40 repeat protein